MAKDRQMPPSGEHKLLDPESARTVKKGARGPRPDKTPSLRRKKALTVRLNHGIAETSVREAVVLDRAVKVIGDMSEALRWMGTPVRDLGYATPVSLLGTPAGRDAVLVVLGRLEHGVL